MGGVSCSGRESRAAGLVRSVVFPGIGRPGKFRVTAALDRISDFVGSRLTVSSGIASRSFLELLAPIILVPVILAVVSSIEARAGAEPTNRGTRARTVETTPSGSESAAVEAGRNHGYLQGDSMAGDVCAASISVTNTDNTYENAFAWQFGGTREPSFGSFAERFDFIVPAGLCGTVFDLTKLETANDGVMDVYVWEDAEGLPGAVRAVRTAVSPGAVAVWPAVSRHQVELDLDLMSGPFWAGYWGDWPHATACFFITADLDGPGGTPRTNIAPGLEFPLGWQDVSLVWGGTQALGIGVLQLTDLVSVDSESSESEAENSNGPLAAESTFRAVWPTPSSGEVRFSFDLSKPAFVEAVVVDVNGRVVDAIPPVWMEAGVRELVWDCEPENGAVSPGIYFVRAMARDAGGARTIHGRALVAR